MFTLKDDKQSVIGLVCDSFRLINKTWAVNIVTVLIFYILHVVISYFFDHHALAFDVRNWNYLTLTQSQASSAGISTSVNSNGFTDPEWMRIIGVILSVWLTLTFRAILARACWNVATSGNARIGNAFAMGLKYLYVYFTVMVIYFVVGAILYCIVYLFSMIGLDWLTAIIAILAAAAFYYILVKFILVEVIAVVEDCGFKAIGRAWAITSFGWWRTVGTLIFSSVFYIVMLILVGVGIFLALAFPGLAGQGMHAVGSTASPAWFGFLLRIDAVLTIICILFTVPSLYAGAQVVLLNDLKHRAGESS